MPAEIFDTVTFRLSKTVIEMIREHTAEAEKEDGWNEFVEAALRRSLLEGWDARHLNASSERGRYVREWRQR